MRSLLWLFLYDFFHQILFYFGTVVATGILLWEKFKQKPIHWRWIIAFFLFCVFVSCFQAWVDEHRNSEQLVSEKARLYGEQEFWKGQSYSKDATIRGLTTTLLATIKPEPQQYIFFQQKLNEKAFQMIVTTNKPHPSLNLVMTCDGDFQSYNFQIARPEGETLNLGPSTMRSKREAELIAFAPAWDQMHPLVINIFGASSQLKKCNLKPL